MARGRKGKERNEKRLGDAIHTPITGLLLLLWSFLLNHQQQQQQDQGVKERKKEKSSHCLYTLHIQYLLLLYHFPYSLILVCPLFIIYLTQVFVLRATPTYCTSVASPPPRQRLPLTD